MGGCWESERGCRARGRETDNKRPALPQSSKEPFQQSVYQSKRAYSVHTPDKHQVAETALCLLLKLYFTQSPAASSECVDLGTAAVNVSFSDG